MGLINIKEFSALDYNLFNFFNFIKIPKSDNNEINQFRLTIPFFQRKYNWGKEEVFTLFKDLENFYKNNHENNNTYYLGNIILKEKNNNINNGDKNLIYNFDLIDGQQRITTFLLIVNYLKICLLEKFEENDKFDFYLETLNKLIFNINSLEEEERVLKIKNEESDNILTYIFNLEEFNPNIGDDNSFSENEFNQSNYYNNFNFIKEKIIINDFKDWERWFNILNKIKVVVIFLSENDNEIEVFESINSKGLSLNIMDLVKNYFLLVANNLKINAERQKLIDREFSKLEKVFTVRKKVKNDKGENKILLKIDEKSMNRFFAAYITKISAINKNFIDPNNKNDVNKLYSEFKSVINLNDQKNFDFLWKDLKSSIYYYSNLINLKKYFFNGINKKLVVSSNMLNEKKEEILNPSLAYLSFSKLNLYLPFLLLLKDVEEKDVEDEEKTKNKKQEIFNILNLLDFHNVTISFQKQNDDNRFISNYLLNIYNKGEKIKYESLLSYLKNGNKNNDNKSLFPDKDLFYQSLEKSNIFVSNKNVAKYILYRIENNLRKESHDKPILFNYSVEHVFPQKGWKNWDKKFNDATYLKESVDCLGNLTLLPPSKNSSFKDVSFENKVKKLKGGLIDGKEVAADPLSINKYFINYFDKNNSWEINLPPEKNSSIDRLNEYLKPNINKIWKEQIKQVWQKK